MSNAISPYHYLSAQGSESISLNGQEQFSPFLYIPQSEFVVNPFPNYTKNLIQPLDSTSTAKGLFDIKYDDFSRTTNVTLGLPIIRVSVDHGTATELVGTGKVDISSFIQALKVARDISKSAI